MNLSFGVGIAGILNSPPLEEGLKEELAKWYFHCIEAKAADFFSEINYAGFIDNNTRLNLAKETVKRIKEKMPKDLEVLAKLGRRMILHEAFATRERIIEFRDKGNYAKAIEAAEEYRDKIEPLNFMQLKKDFDGRLRDYEYIMRDVIGPIWDKIEARESRLRE